MNETDLNVNLVEIGPTGSQEKLSTHVSTGGAFGVGGFIAQFTIIIRRRGARCGITVVRATCLTRGLLPNYFAWVVK